MGDEAQGGVQLRVLVIDNYDSFTYNLVQALGALGAKVEVHRNDAVPLDQIRSRAPDRIVLSPGPVDFMSRRSGMNDKGKGVSHGFAVHPLANGALSGSGFLGL